MKFVIIIIIVIDKCVYQDPYIIALAGIYNAALAISEVEIIKALDTYTIDLNTKVFLYSLYWLEYFE